MARSPRIRALVLAAGLGQRLQPLTGMLPKPLLPAAGQTVAAHSLNQLRMVGCEAVALNLHHRGEQIRDTFGETWGGLDIYYSEEEELLGTLGALRPLREFFRECDLAILLNGDSLCRWPLKRMLRKHQKSGAEATVLVNSRPDPERYGGGIALDETGRVVQFRKVGPQRGKIKRRAVFTGAHVLSRSFLDRVPNGVGPADIVGDLYQPMLAAGAHFHAMTTSRAWHDLGTPDRYLEGVCDWARGRAPVRWLRRNWISAGARVGSRVRLRQVALEAGAVVGAKSRLEQVVVLSGARVGEGCRLHRVILGPNVNLPPGSKVEHRVVTPLSAGRADGARDSVLGQLVFTPIL